MSGKSQVIILNGPPGSGKDTIANLLAQQGFTHRRFKEPLYRLTAMLFDMHPDTLKELATNRDTKDTENIRIQHPKTKVLMTPREALMYTSEECLKPYMGKDFFGKLASSEINSDTVFSDGGFEEEVDVLLENHEVWIFRLHREGYTFERDSRDYLEKGINIYLEEGKPEQAVETILKIVTHC